MTPSERFVMEIFYEAFVGVAVGKVDELFITYYINNNCSTNTNLIIVGSL